MFPAIVSRHLSLHCFPPFRFNNVSRFGGSREISKSPWRGDNFSCCYSSRWRVSGARKRRIWLPRQSLEESTRSSICGAKLLASKACVPFKLVALQGLDHNHHVALSGMVIPRWMANGSTGTMRFYPTGTRTTQSGIRKPDTFLLVLQLQQTPLACHCAGPT